MKCCSLSKQKVIEVKLRQFFIHYISQIKKKVKTDLLTRYDERSTFTIAEGQLILMSDLHDNTVAIKSITTKIIYSVIPLLKIQFTNAFTCEQIGLYIQDYLLQYYL